MVPRFSLHWLNKKEVTILSPRTLFHPFLLYKTRAGRTVVTFIQNIQRELL